MRFLNQYYFIKTISQTLKYGLTTIIIAMIYSLSYSQENLKTVDRFFSPVDSFNQSRFYAVSTVGTLVYSGATVALYYAWYKDYPLGPFHWYRDWGEWQNMDKIGHFYTAWMQGTLGNSLAKWSGLEKKKAIISGVILGTLFQSTIEIMDGYSTKWGFSGADIGANLLGTAVFAAQAYYWDEQRIKFKFGSFPKNYSTELIYATNGTGSTSLGQRADDLFGTGLPARTLKDYNAQSYWASVNLSSFFPQSKVPKWLNIAIGYSPENLFGGYANRWTKDDLQFELSGQSYPRYHQFFIAPDIDWSKLNPKSAFLRSVLTLLNIFKVPAPAIEINNRNGGEIHFYLVYF